MIVKKCAALAVMFSIFLVQTASANVGEAFGFGSRTMSLAGAGVAGGTGPYSAYHNPADLGLETEGRTNSRLKVAYGLVYVQPNFLPITNIVTQNKFIADAEQMGNVDTSYRETLGQEIGLSFRLFPEFLNLTLGLATFVPLNQLAYMDSGEAYVPEYVLYRSRTQRPQFELGLGSDLFGGLRAGVGLHFAFTLTGNASIFLNTRADSISSMRFSASLKPKVAPYVGLLYAPPEDPQLYSIGFVFRAPVSSENTMKLSSAARVFGDFAAVDFNFTAFSTMFYDPMALEFGGAFQITDEWKSYIQLDYQFWSQFKSPALLIQNPDTTNCKSTTGNPNDCGPVQIKPGAIPAFAYRNIWIPRIGEEWKVSDVSTIRFGYAYRPSILDGPPNGAGNYLDPSKHMLNLGLGLNYPTLLGHNIPWSIDFNFTFQYLERQTITKTSGNEVNDPTDRKIGAPGYVAGGTLLGGGVTVSLAL